MKRTVIALAALAVAVSAQGNSGNERQVTVYLRNSTAVPFVLRAVTSASDDVVEQALLALGESRDERAIAPLRDHTDDDRPDVRAAALLGLSLARLPSADEFLISLVESAPDRGVKEVLRALKPRLHDDALVGRLQVALGARSESLRRLLEEGLAGSRQGSPLQGTTERAR